jgi:tRNA nucleotidyltransferase (CCA-adding enzyme)
MGLSNAELTYYDSNVLRLPADKRKEYHAQVDRLIAELSRTLRDQTEIKITKVVKAGSFAKYTILRKTAEDPVDVDVIFYISGCDVDHETLSSLSDTIHKLLLKIYPNKDVEDFEIQRKAATVSFVGSGLSVDIVPVIEDEARPGYAPLRSSADDLLSR